MFKYYIVLFFIVIHIYGFSQNSEFEKFRGNKITSNLVINLPNSYFKIYNDSANKAYSGYKFESASINNTPEDILKLIYSVKEKSLLKDFCFNTEINLSNGEISRRYNSDSSNYFRFIHKITFDYKNQQVIVVKFFEYIKNIKVNVYSLQMQNFNGRWKVVKHKDLENIEKLILKIKTESFLDFLTGKDTQNKEINKLYREVLENGRVLNLTKLAQTIDNLKILNSALYEKICDN